MLKNLVKMNCYLIIAIFILVVPIGVSAQNAQQKPFNMEVFNTVLDRIYSDYVEPADGNKLLEGALNGMLSALDPHSAYLDPKMFEELRSHTKGEFGGLGMEVTMENGFVKVVSPIDDTPAYKAGLKAGDLIVAIDKKPIMGMNLLEAVEKMRGKPGTQIILHIKRKGKADVFPVNLTRAMIHVKSVKWRTEDNVGYIRIATFNEQTVALLKEAVESLKKQLKNKLQGFVIDVRNDPGGLLDEAIATSDLFLDGGEIVSTRGRDPQKDVHFKATSGDIAKNIPIVVLINGGSASASEILAGALQDHKRAVVVGTKSFGKGSIQLLIPLNNGGAFKLTIARYYTPSGRSIQAKGIEPDIVVEQAITKLEAVNDEDRLREQDYIGALDAPSETQKKKQGDSKSDSKSRPTEKKGDKPSKDEDNDFKLDLEGNKNKEIEDYQLLRALDIVRAIALTNKCAK